jgi:hypothetical protein
MEYSNALLARSPRGCSVARADERGLDIRQPEDRASDTFILSARGNVRQRQALASTATEQIARRDSMRYFVIGLAGIMTSLVAWPSSAQVWEEEVVRPPPRVVERDVIVREPAWRSYAWDDCRTVVERRQRPDGTLIVRRIRHC